MTESTTFGYFEARGHWAPFSFTSNLNFDRRQTIANMAYVTIGRDGKIEIQALLNQVPRLETTHVIADIFGYTL
ncbi:hypothetical protein ASF64_10180 [Arthrobacter sp. Leaf137]|nr:hypothetical protein ASF64_10180 [Arthrobacter sp. Leaf137]